MKIEREDLMRILGVQYEALRKIEQRDQLEERLQAVGYHLISREVIGNNGVEYEVVPTNFVPTSSVPTNFVPTSSVPTSDPTISDPTTYEDFIESIEVYDEYTGQMRKPYFDKTKFRTFLIERSNKPSIDLNELARKVSCSPATIIRWTKFLIENRAIGRKIVISNDQTITI